MALLGAAHWMEAGAKRPNPPYFKTVVLISKWLNLKQLYLSLARSKNYINPVKHLKLHADTQIVILLSIIEF